VRYWDSSALLPLIIPERDSEVVRRLYQSDPLVLTWWGTPVEIASALARRERTGESPAEQVAVFRQRALRLGERWQEILAAESVRTAAIALLSRRELRAADALQLGAALIARDLADSRLSAFVTGDERLAVAAAAEGFDVLP